MFFLVLPLLRTEGLIQSIGCGWMPVQGYEMQCCAVQMLSGLQYNAGQMQYQLPPGVVNSDGTLHPQAQILLAALAAQVRAASSSTSHSFQCTM